LVFFFRGAATGAVTGVLGTFGDEFEFVVFALFELFGA
jgi:hypothetical protein